MAVSSTRGRRVRRKEKKGLFAHLKNLGFTNRLALYIMLFLAAGLAGGFYLAVKSISTGYTGALMCWTVVFTPIGTACSIVLSRIVDKSRAENTSADGEGIKYAAAKARGMEMDWVGLVVSILSGLAAAIPLVVQLVNYVQKAVKEKNWNKMLEMVMDLMETAEGMFESGADRKEWVIAMVKGSADTINYDIDIEAISALIDSLCDMSKVVNNSVTPEETPDE